MRIRHHSKLDPNVTGNGGLFNFWYHTVARISGTLDQTDLTNWTRATAALWLWRVKSWAFTGSLAWQNVDNGVGLQTGSLSFSNIILPADGPLQFEDLRDGSEKDLLHRQYFLSQVSDTQGGYVVTINLGIGSLGNTERHDNATPIPSYQTREFLLNTTLAIGLDIGIGFAPVTYQFATGAPGDTYYFQADLGTVVSDGDTGGTVQAVPYEWYEYRDADGNNPVWDSVTGAQLLDPRGV